MRVVSEHRLTQTHEDSLFTQDDLGQSWVLAAVWLLYANYLGLQNKTGVFAIVTEKLSIMTTIGGKIFLGSTTS